MASPVTIGWIFAAIWLLFQGYYLRHRGEWSRLAILFWLVADVVFLGGAITLLILGTEANA
jgi:hypothetical protein